jgi:FHS family L-fucose permease-like MFS transporter
MVGGAPIGNVSTTIILIGRQAFFPLALVTTLFFSWGFAYRLLDVLNKHFQKVCDLSKLKSTKLQVAYFGAYIVYPLLIGTSVMHRVVTLDVFRENHV